MGRRQLQNNSSLYDLAIRLLGGPTEAQRGLKPIRLLVGRLPEDLQVHLPFPLSGRLVGSCQWGQQQNTVAVFEVPSSPEEAMDRYGDVLEAHGWQKAPIPEVEDRARAAWGFCAPFGRPEGTRPQPSSQAVMHTYHRPDSPVLDVVAQAVADGLTDLHATLLSPSLPVVTWLPPFRYEQQWRGIIPKLLPPARSRFTNLHGSSNADRGYSTITLVTLLDLMELVAHYSAQLEQGDWSPIESHRIEDVAWWSIWLVPDPSGSPWEGSLHVLRVPWRPGEAVLEVEVYRP